MNSRRRIASPEAQDKALYWIGSGPLSGQPMSALGHKRTYAVHKAMSALPPNSNRKSGFPHKVMSALPPKADMCSALAHVCFGPIADIRQSIRNHYRAQQLTLSISE
jgi:hypothetical protein